MMTRNVMERPITGYNSIGKFMRSVKTLSLAKRKSWIAKMVDADKIYIEQAASRNINDSISSQLTEDQKTPFKRSIFACIDALNSIYGNDWDMHLEKFLFDEGNGQGVKTRFMLTPIVHFKKLTIKNGYGLSREVRDLFVAIPIRGNGFTTGDDGRSYLTLCPRTPYGLRTTFFNDEKRVHYIHSHLPSVTYSDNSEAAFSFQKFCIGGGSELHDLIMEMEHEFSPGIFALFLVSLRTLVEWESIEGGPHIRMEKIGSQIATTLKEDYQKKHFDELIPDMMSNMNVNFVKHNDIFKIKRDETFESVIKNKLYAKAARGSSEYFNFIAKEIGGKWECYNDAVSITTKKVLENNYLIFNGREYHYTELPTASENNNNSTNDITTYRVYPKFLNYVADQLEQILLKASVRNRLSRITNQSGNARAYT